MRYFASSGLLVGLLLVFGCSPITNLGRKITGGLAVGDQAPAIRIQKLVHGSMIDIETLSGVKVIEFWATWCGPCLSGMPHLSDLQQTYGEEVTILGISSEDSATVEAFLASSAGDSGTWADVVKYRLAVDDNGATGAAYMRAAGVNSIPTAFIVGQDGVLQWIGHPASMDAPLKAVLEGTWRLPESD